MSVFFKTKLMSTHMSGHNNNLITTKPKAEPFRVSDGVMRIGKYRKKKLSELPKWYLRWMLKEMDLNPTRVSMIKEVL